MSHRRQRNLAAVHDRSRSARSPALAQLSDRPVFGDGTPESAEAAYGAGARYSVCGRCGHASVVFGDGRGTVHEQAVFGNWNTTGSDDECPCGCPEAVRP